MNFCEEPEWLAFRIVDGVLVWETPTDGPPLSNCIASPTRQKTVRLHEAMDWLREALQDEDQPAAAMNRQARALGHADSTVRRACERLEIRHIRCEFGPVGLWMWALPKPDEEEQRHTELPEEKENRSPNKTPPGPPLRRGGNARSAQSKRLRKGRRSATDESPNLPSPPNEATGKSPKGKNARRKGAVASPSFSKFPDRSRSNAGWRELFAEVLAGLGGGERGRRTGDGG
jgi:hypothetical protein